MSNQAARQMKRTRYKRACKPLMEKYNLKSADVASFVTSAMNENDKLRKENEEARAEINRLRQIVNAANAVADSEKVKNQELMFESNKLKAENLELKNRCGEDIDE